MSLRELYDRETEATSATLTTFMAVISLVNAVLWTVNGVIDDVQWWHWLMVAAWIVLGLHWAYAWRRRHVRLRQDEQVDVSQ